jgi:hypothetical protein
VTILVGTGRFLLAALIVFTESARGFDVVKSKIERDQDVTPKVGHRRADQTKSSVRFAVTRFAAMAKETLRSTCVSLGRIVLKQPIARSVAGRLLNLHPDCLSLGGAIERSHVYGYLDPSGFDEKYRRPVAHGDGGLAATEAATGFVEELYNYDVS